MKKTVIKDKEKEKYYTPTIEEFHVGFEHEVLSSYGWQKGTWPKVLDEDDWAAKERGVMKATKECSTRVKYLDKEDIEELICRNASDYHTIFKLRNKYENELVFQTYWIEENEYLDEEYIYWNTKYNKFKITHKSKTLFWGNIKNKSELKIILIQIGVIK